MRISGSLLVLFTALTLTFACGGSSPEKQLEAATTRVAEAEQGIEAARLEVEQEESDLESAQADLARAIKKLKKAEDRLTEAKVKLADVADDTYLFRTVQSALLAEPALKGLAISARVNDRVVTLEGGAPSLELRKKAGAVAGSVLGVERVENEVTVQPPPAAKKP